MLSVMAQMRPSRKDDRLRSRSASRRNILMLRPVDKLGEAGRRQLPAHVAEEPPQKRHFVAREFPVCRRAERRQPYPVEEAPERTARLAVLHHREPAAGSKHPSGFSQELVPNLATELVHGVGTADRVEAGGGKGPVRRVADDLQTGRPKVAARCPGRVGAPSARQGWCPGFPAQPQKGRAGRGAYAGPWTDRTSRSRCSGASGPSAPTALAYRRIPGMAVRPCRKMLSRTVAMTASRMVLSPGRLLA